MGGPPRSGRAHHFALPRKEDEVTKVLVLLSRIMGFEDSASTYLIAILKVRVVREAQCTI